MKKLILQILKKISQLSIEHLYYTYDISDMLNLL